MKPAMIGIQYLKRTNPRMSSSINITSADIADNMAVVTAVFTLETVEIMCCYFIGFLFFWSPHEKLTQLMLNSNESMSQRVSIHSH